MRERRHPAQHSGDVSATSIREISLARITVQIGEWNTATAGLDRMRQVRQVNASGLRSHFCAHVPAVLQNLAIKRLSP